METTQSSDPSKSTLGGAESGDPIDERASELFDPNPLQEVPRDIDEPTDSTGDEGHAKPSQSTRPIINTYSVETDETLDVDDDDFLCEFVEGLKLDRSIVGEATNECCQKAKVFVRNDLFYATTTDNLRPATECERANEATLSPTHPNHRHEVSGDDVDVDRDRDESTSSSESECGETAAPNAQPNHNTADDDVNRQPAKHIQINNRFTRQRRYKHTYYDSDGHEVTFDSQSATTTTDSYYGGITGLSKSTTTHWLPATTVAMSKPINDSRADSDQPKVPTCSSLFPRQRRNKHTYFDSDGNEIVFDSETNNGPVPETCAAAGETEEI